MKLLAVLAAFAISISTIKAGVIPSNYNLIGFHAHVAPQPVTFGHPGIISEPLQDVTHPAVVENSLAEAQLPQELVNPFYKNPAIAAGLAKESWFINKEFPVHNREADKISRNEIFKIINRIHLAHQ